MTLREAIRACFTPDQFSAIKNGTNPPELLKMAVHQCFLHEQAPGVEAVVRAGAIFLDATGRMPPMDLDAQPK